MTNRDSSPAVTNEDIRRCWEKRQHPEENGIGADKSEGTTAGINSGPLRFHESFLLVTETRLRVTLQVTRRPWRTGESRV